MSQKPFPAYQGVEPFVFVSYAHADDELVFPELLRLHEAGYRIWYDEGINPAEEWTRSISTALITSKLVLIYLSPQALASKWVRREISQAVRKDKELLPIYLQPLVLPDHLEFEIGQVQALERHILPPDDYYQRLTRRLDQIPDINRRQKEDLAARRERDLRTAREIQGGLLPQSFPSVPGYSFWAMMESFAGGPGGDLYDLRTLPTGEILIVIADMAGKGVPAALGMALLAGMFSVAVEAYGPDLVAVLQAVNRAFFRHVEDRFATLLAVAIDPRTHQLRVVNAGHEPGLIRRRDGTVQDLTPPRSGGLPLGVMEEANYEVQTAALGSGEAVLLTTDGVSESTRGRGEIYGLERKAAVLARTRGDAAALGAAVLADVKAFTGDAAPQDDTTIVCFARDS